MFFFLRFKYKCYVVCLSKIKNKKEKSRNQFLHIFALMNFNNYTEWIALSSRG